MPVLASPPVWFDFENTPHVLFLEPLHRQVHELGIPTRVTARPQAQTLELSAERGVAVEAIGTGDLATTGAKILGGATRAAALVRWASRIPKPRLLISSSRTAALASMVLRIPSIGIMDYERSNHWALAMAAEALWMPDLLRNAPLPARTRRRARYFAGLKENLYLDDWAIDRAGMRGQAGIGEGERLIVARPPATTAHYAADKGLEIWLRAMHELLADSSTRFMVLPRTAAQRESLIDLLPASDSITIPAHTIAGPQMVAAADLVLSGGGTMNREAAVLGVPAWSVFSGPAPHVDECLVREGRLRWVRSSDELRDALSAYPEPPRSRRGPYPEGITSIMTSIEGHLR